MEQEKVFIHFKTTKPNKDGLEMLARKKGVSVTQLLNDLIFNEVKGAIVKEAQTAALKVVFTEYKLPNYLFLKLKYFPPTIWEEIKNVLGEKKGGECGNRWEKLLLQKISDDCKKLGIEDFDVSYSELMKTVSDN